MDTEQIIGQIKSGGQAAEDIADTLERIAIAFDMLLAGGLTERALVLLVKDKSQGVSIPDVRLVLKALPRLREFIDIPEDSIPWKSLAEPKETTE